MSRRHPQQEQSAAVLAPARIDGVRTGTLIALAEDGLTPLVRYAGQSGEGAIAARTVVDLHAAHLGAELVLMFDGGDPTRPIVMGVLRAASQLPAAAVPGQLEIDADGARMLVAAREQLVLRCGAASITLTRAGKVLIQGSYISSRSTGVQRIKGGSVQIN